MNLQTESAYSLGSFLVQEFFSIVKDAEPFLQKVKSPKDLIKDDKKWTVQEKLKVVRFCTLSLELFNCANRFFDTFPQSKESVKINPYTEAFLSGAFNKGEFDDFIKNFKLEVVFTAHPTEVFPLSVLKNINRLEMLIEKFFTSKSTEKQYRYTQALRASLTTLWLTDEIYRAKPTPEDEADKLFYIFEASLWKASPYFFRRYYWQYKKKFNEAPKHYPNLKFSSWIGGDRDGNPFVTSDSTYKIITKSRRKVLRLILLELYSLRDEMLIKSTQKEMNKLYKGKKFPYKALFEEIVAEIQTTLKEHKTDQVLDLQAFILKRLKLAYKMLCKDGAKRVADRRLRSLIDRIEAFSLSPFKLDLRQDSEVHSEIVAELKKLTNCTDELCMKKVKKIPFHKLSKLGQDFFKTLKLSNDFNPNPFNCYIISMTRSTQDIKNLELLLKVAAVERLPIVPLFETPEDIRNASHIIKECKKEKLKLSQVMWGYSDSTKKGGRLASAWNVYKAQKEAIELDAKLVHFHGRGGSIARGGGSLQNIFGVMPQNIVGHHFRQTFQGEVIQDDFGLYVRAIKTLEQILKECTLNHFQKKNKETTKGNLELDRLSDLSEKKFQKKFYEDAKFSETFRDHSPISIINKMNLGSRPAKRASKKLGVSYRAIPWVFSWAQTRGALPVWYGLQGLEAALLKVRKNSHFTASFLSSVFEGLSLTDPKIFKTYFGKTLKTETEELKDLKENFKIPNLKNDLRKDFANYLHKNQSSLLKKDELSGTEEDIQKITAQGIATFLGRSG